MPQTNKLVGENLYNNPSESKINKINRTEAAAIYNRMREIYGQFGAAEQQIQFDWRRRFLEISDEERADYKEGDVLEILRPGTNAISVPSVRNRKMDILEEEEEQRQIKADKLRGINPGIPTTDDKPERLFTKPTDAYKRHKKIIVPQKNRHKFGKDYVPKRKFVKNTEQIVKLYNLNSNTIKSPATVGNALFLISETVKYAVAHRQMMELAEYLNKKSQLQKDIKKEKYRLVPPKPRKVLEAISVLRNYGRMSANSFEKDKIMNALQELNIILEDSRAFWGNN